MKREYFISYFYKSAKYGTGYGHFTKAWYGKLKADDFGILIDSAQGALSEYYKDMNEYFDIVILSISKF